jgi:hypothetical protein
MSLVTGISPMVAAVAREQSTLRLLLAYRDHTGNAMTPNLVTWTLTDADGNVVNGRDQVAIPNPGTQSVLYLQGDDLAILDGRPHELRVLAVEGTYDSGAQQDLPFTYAHLFWVEALAAVE